MRAAELRRRVRDSVIAGSVGWAAGYLITLPFEISTAQRYMTGQHGSFLFVLAEGLCVWAAFTLFLAALPWLLLILPISIVIPPQWIVRLRKMLIPLAPALGVFAIGRRLGLFERAHFRHIGVFVHVFVVGPVVFAAVFALVFAIAFVRRSAGPPVPER